MKNTESIFDYKDYKEYLKDLLKQKPKRGHGFKSAIADAIRCQSAYISRVLNGNAHFSLEQAHDLNSYLGHSEEESDFFIFLVSYARSGTQALQKFFLKKISETLNKRLILKERFKIKMNLSLEDQAMYYSAWYYVAAHLLLSIPEFQTKQAIAEYLNLPLSKITEILNCLLHSGLAIKKGERYGIGETRIHLGSDSPFINKHHINWRMKTIQSLDQNHPTENEDLHYSSIVSVSKDDIDKIKSKFIKTIDEFNGTVKDSKEERLQCFTLDFFKI